MPRLAPALLLAALPACADASSDESARDCDAEFVRLAVFDDLLHASAWFDGDHVVVDASEHSYDHRRLVRVDRCGESVETLLDEVVDIATAPAPSLPWIVQLGDEADTPGAWLVDVFGSRPPWHLGDAAPNVVGHSARGVLLEEDGELVELVMDDEGQVAEHVLAADVDDVRMGTDGLEHNVLLHTDEAWMLVDIEAGVQDPVAGPTASPWFADGSAGRFFVVYTPVTRGAREWVHDRIAGTYVALGRPSWRDPYSIMLDGIVTGRNKPDPDTPAEVQLVLLPEMRELWWPTDEAYTDAAVAPDGTRVLVGDAVVLRLAPGADSPEPVPFTRAQPDSKLAVSYARGSFWIVEATPSFALSNWLYRVYRSDANGTSFAAVLDAPEIVDRVELAGDRWVTFEGAADPDGRREAWLRDPSAARDRVLTTEARDGLWYLNRRVGPASDDPPSELLVLTGDRERSTLWRVRPD